MRSRWATILSSLILLAAIVALHSWSLSTYAEMARKHESRPATLERQLQQFRDETNPQNRIDLVQKFGQIKDPRVVVTLMEAVQSEVAKVWTDRNQGLLEIASSSLIYYHIPKEDWVPTKYWSAALIWWEKNEFEVRRRAEALSK